MSFALLIAGIIFLVNPTVRMIDLLPDFVGCLLLFAGLSRLYVLEERLERARKLLCYFMLVSALKIPASLYFPIKAKQYLLPFSFAFSVVEIILMVSFFVSLTGGLEYLASRDGVMKGHGKRSESASIVAFIFSIARGVLSFAPELLVLGEQTDDFDYTFSPTPGQNAALIKPYAEVLCFVLVLVFGIYTAVVLIKYLTHLRNDKVFIKRLHERYLQYERDNFVTLTQRRMKLALLVIFIGIVLLLNPVVDFMNVLPNTLSVLFLSAGLVLLSRASGDRGFIRLLPIAALTIPVSIWNNVTQYTLLSETNIDIMGTSMTVRFVPEVLRNLGFLKSDFMLIVPEYILIAVLFFLAIKRICDLDILRDNDTIGIFEILLGISSATYFAACVGAWIFPHIRTAYSFMTNDIASYIRYDSITEIFEIVSYVAYIFMLYFSYRFGKDVLSRVVEREESEKDKTISD